MRTSTGQRIVLVADDEAITRKLIVCELTAVGLMPLVCESGRCALAYFSLGVRVDALVTDIRMPGAVCGLMLAAEARSQRPRLPVVYVSARAAPAERMVPGSRFVSKPYRVGSVADAVRGILSLPPRASETVTPMP